MKLVILLLLFFSISWADPVVEIRTFHGNSNGQQKTDEFRWLDKPLGPIDPVERDRFFKSADLTADLVSFDSVEKNMLYYRLSRLPSNRVSASYPGIAKEKIMRASRMIKAGQL